MGGRYDEEWLEEWKDEWMNDAPKTMSSYDIPQKIFSSDYV